MKNSKSRDKMIFSSIFFLWGHPDFPVSIRPQKVFSEQPLFCVIRYLRYHFSTSDSGNLIQVAKHLSGTSRWIGSPCRVWGHSQKGGGSFTDREQSLKDVQCVGRNTPPKTNLDIIDHSYTQTDFSTSSDKAALSGSNWQLLFHMPHIIVSRFLATVWRALLEISPFCTILS